MGMHVPAMFYSLLQISLTVVLTVFQSEGSKSNFGMLVLLVPTVQQYLTSKSNNSPTTT